MNRRPLLGEPVRIVAGPASGLTGVVVRLLRRSEPACWIALSERRVAICPFPISDNRASHALIAFADLEAA